MKRIPYILLSISILLAGIFSSAFAFYNFSDVHKIDDIETNFVNARFEDINNDYYKIYFFASPYYATGADGIDSSDPLVIADSNNNPYNSKEEYGITFDSLNGNNEKFANTKLKNKNNAYNNYYVSARNIVNDSNGNATSIELYQKKDFYGYIRQNEKYGIYEATSTYVSLTVRGNISSDILADIIVSSEFKDQYGFGPEFVGWTYDKETTKKRTMYGSNRFKNGAYSVSNDGIVDFVSLPQIGNYGCQGEIAQVSASTSLYYLDNLAISSDSTMAYDGSQVNDHIIYLYPVFEAKNYSSDKSIGGVATPFLKFRINSDNDLNSDTFYGYNQKGEIDYSKKRYTVGLFQKEKDDLEINYYTKGIYIDTSDESNVKDMQIDANAVSSYNNWRPAWNSIITSQELIDLNLEPGYYNVDINFIQYSIPSDVKTFEKEQNTRVTNLVQQFKNTNKYIAVYGSKQNDHRDTYGLYWLPRDYGSNSKDPTSYVIGFEKVDEYHITGDNLNGSINDYSASGYKKLFTVDINTVSRQYFTTDYVYLAKDDEIAILNENCSSLKDASYVLNPMIENDTIHELTDFNNYLASSNHTNKNPFSNLGSEAIIVNQDDSGNVTTTKGNVLMQLSGTNKIKINEGGNYSLVFCLEKKDGKLTSINIAYRKNSEQFAFVILNNKPNDNVFIDFDELRNSSNCVATTTSDVHSILSLSSPLTSNNSDITSFQTLFEKYSNKVLIDTATGYVISKDLFINSNFTLNRSYVVYLSDVN